MSAIDNHQNFFLDKNEHILLTIAPNDGGTPSEHLSDSYKSLVPH